MGITLKQFFIFFAPLALVLLLWSTSFTPAAPQLLPEQQEALYKGNASGISFREMSMTIGAQNAEGDSALQLADRFAEKGFGDAAKQWRLFDAEHRRSRENTALMIDAAILALAALALLKTVAFFAAPRRAANDITLGGLLESESMTAFAALLACFLFLHPPYYSEFVSVTDSVPMLYALCYFGIAVRARYKAWDSARKNPGVTEPINAAPLFEISAALLMAVVWGTWLAYFPLKLGTPALVPGYILRVAAAFAPWMGMRFLPRYSHLRHQGLSGAILAALPIGAVTVMVVANL